METILIAGAGKGIGKSTAELAYALGYNVIAVSRNSSDLNNKPYKTLELDLINDDSITVLSNLKQSVGYIVNCTGTALIEKDVGQEDWKDDIMKLINLNVRPTLNLYAAFLPKFRSLKKGHFLHISSGALDFFDKSETGYCASKAALESIVLSLQNGESENGILHHALRVALTDTPLARRVCPTVKDWSKHYTPMEIAYQLIDIIKNPKTYPKPIIPFPYKPIRIKK